MMSGMVSIVGRPNVGKSTLLNKILGKKISITSDKCGTTRNIILGSYNDSDSQIVFCDTPGISKPTHKLENLLNQKSFMMSDNIDLILFMVDIKSGFGKGDNFILNRIKDSGIPIILLLNKVDQVDKEVLIKRIDELKDIYDFKEIIPISGLKGINVNDLIKTIKKYLPNDFKYYDDDFVTNQPMKLIITERVREKILNSTSDEIPHSVACVLEEYENTDELLKIGVLIVVDRENLKKIIIGKGGSMLKRIGTSARIDLEEYFGKKVYLSLYVKTLKSWRDKDSMMNELGLKDDLME